MKSIHILFFASIKAAIGKSRIELEVDETATVGSVLEILYASYPQLGAVKAHTLVAMNQRFIIENEAVPDGAELALFPPVSGGDAPRIHVEVGFDEINLNDLAERLTDVSTGGICIFTGVVRGVTTHGQAHQTSRLEYEAYIPMAEEKLRQIAVEIQARWSQIHAITLIQRIGVLEPGTISVVVACASEHRDSGIFEGARYGIDRLKEIVPIWKKEVSPDGEAWVEGTYHIKPGD